MELKVVAPETEYQRMPSTKLLLLIAMGSMVMLFAGMTSAYLVRQAEGNWLLFELPKLFWVSTTMIVISSITIQWAYKAAKANNSAAVLQASFITTVLGFGFLICQYFAWSKLYSQGIVFGGAQSNPAGSFMYVITGLHVAHLIGGLIALLVVLFNATKKVYSSTHCQGLQNCAIYWHFLTGLWIYLFFFLLYVR